jgi:predicted O-methyltransferase YrrM
MLKLPLDWEIYIERHNSPLPSILDEIERQTHLKTVYPQMLSGKIQASILHFLTAFTRPSHILEIGTFTGYATIAMASALNENAVIDTVESDETAASMAQNFFDRTPWKNRIRLIQGNALEIIPNLPHTYDLIFLDADKENYPAYYKLIKNRLAPGGLWITDNVLWNGKVIYPDDRQARAIDRFNTLVMHDPDLEQIIIPVRDGLMLTRFKNG